ncbi:MAG TPA: hypothetical protein PLX89_07170 [Verrucomicrobiota bacterium]|nr:hypothetical protein [Verrucomicrobiales bacterium]HRI12771.1 hypothetical protein [Verrucomicrobiota bacterium]
MTPNRILPDLQCSLLVEDVRQETSGNLILVGVLGVIRVPQVPIAAPKVCVINRWCAGIGQFTEQVRLVAPDGQQVLRKNTAKFALPDPTQTATLVSIFPGIEFPAAGVYHIEVLVEDVMKVRYPVPVVVVQQPGQNPGGAQAPKPA